jgi:hypothetical protein
MQIFSGTIKNAVNLQMLNTKWQQKKASDNVLSRSELNARDSWTQEDWLKYNFEQQAEQDREASIKNGISNKIMSGGTLTPDEEKYLAQNDPMTLQKYREIKAEKKNYEEKLKSCKTKDEVQKVKVEKMGEYLSQLKKVENNPCIPLSEKLAVAENILAKSKNILEAEQKFMQSAEYAKLPTEAEEARERAEETKEENQDNLEQIEESVEDAEVSDKDVSDKETSDKETSDAQDVKNTDEGTSDIDDSNGTDTDAEKNVRKKSHGERHTDISDGSPAYKDIEDICNDILRKCGVSTDFKNEASGRVNIIV